MFFFIFSLYHPKASLDKVWIYVDSKSYTLLPELRDPLVQTWIHLGIPLPVPQHAFSERRDDFAGPVLSPKSADRDLVCK
jgi:hypothetical protein